MIDWRPCQLTDFSTSKLQKVCQNKGILYILTYTLCASRHSRVQFFHVRTSESAPRPEVFEHFDLQMCFALQRCNFSELQKVPREWGVLYILTCKCASRYSGVQFFDMWTSKAVRRWGVLGILTCKCASRHSGAQFFDVRTSKSAPNTTCFVRFDFKMRFSPQRRAIFDFSSDHMTPRIPEKTRHFATSHL